MSLAPRSICILRLSAIGDVCHAVATVQAIQRFYPAAEVTWVIGRVEAELVNELPGVRFIVFDKRQGLGAYRQVRCQIEQAFDVLLHMQVAFRANLLAGAIPAKVKYGFPAHLSKELHGLVVNRRVAVSTQPHVLEGFQAFAYALDVPQFAPTWNIPVPADVSAWAASQVEPGKRVLIISPAASKPERSWLADRYAAMADYALERQFQVLLTGGPSDWEQKLATQICTHAAGPIKNLVGQTSLKQLLALLANADVVLAPDTGPAHMAVTQGTPVIGLYAHSNPERTGPYLYRNQVVEVYHLHAEKQHQKGADLLRWGTRVKGDDLMRDIALADVQQMFDRVVAGQRLN